MVVWWGGGGGGFLGSFSVSKLSMLYTCFSINCCISVETPASC